MFLTLSRFIRIFVLGSLRLYQLIVSPYLGQNCRFYPSCSTFAYQAIEHYGVGRGLILTICRLCRCHPFSKGGVDPVKTGLDSPRIP